jgi:hypothetical protein
VASFPGFVRRCRLARAGAALASSLDFLQGTPEKFDLQRSLAERFPQLLVLSP